MTVQRGPAHPASGGRWERAALAAVLLYPLASAFVFPAFVVPMRARLAREAPAEWAQVANDGSFQYASPYLTGNHLREGGLIAGKVRQVWRTGLPYDPFTGDRSLCSWVLNCLNYFVLALFWLLAGGHDQWGMAAAAGAATALRAWSSYRLFKALGRDPRAAALAATVFVFFADAAAWGFSAFYGLLGQAASLKGGLGFLDLGQLPRRLFNPVWVQDSARLPSIGLAVLGVFWLLAGAYGLARTPRSRTAAAVALGAAAGLFGFSHFFEWSVAAGSLLVFCCLAQLALPEAVARRNLRVAGVSAAVACLAYGAWAWRFTAPNRGDILHMLAETPRFEPAAAAYLLYALWMFRRARRRAPERPFWLLLGSLELTVFLLCNSSPLLGFDLQFARHYHLHANLTMAAAVLCALLEKPAVERWASTHAFVACLAVFAWDLSASKAWAEKYFKLHGAPAPVERALRWLDREVPEGPLVVTPSYMAAVGVPIWTRGRLLVTHHSPTAGHPCYGVRRNLEGFAVSLKASGVDIERFLAARWEPALTEAGRVDALTFYARNHALDQHERSAWPEFLLGFAGVAPAPSRAAADEVRRAFRDAAPPSERHYLVLRPPDLPLLAASPESRGGRLAYDADGVRVYEFPAAPASR